MQELTVNVPLLRPDERAPRTGNPVGRLQRIVNGKAAKFRPEDAGLRVEKRNAFTPLGTDVFDVESGQQITLSPTDYPGTQLLTVLDDELIAVGGARPYVYSPSRPGWSRFPSHVLTSPPRKTVVHVANESISLPDMAIVGNIACYVEKEDGITYAKFVDVATKTTIREPFIVGGDSKTKVVADGVNFFLVYTLSAVAIEVYVSVFDASAALVVTDGTQIRLQNGANAWDITAVPGAGNGFALATRSVNQIIIVEGVDISVPAYFPRVYVGVVDDDSLLAVSSMNVDTIPAMPGVAWATNDVDPGFLYLLTTSTTDSYPDSLPTLPGHGVYGARIRLSDLTVNYSYVVRNTLTALQLRQIANLAGYVTGTAGNMLVCWSSYATDLSAGNSGNFCDNTTTTIYAPYGGPVGPIVPVVKRSLSLASRVGKIDGRYVYLAYYASVLDVAVNSEVPNQQQPTYFLVDVESQEIVGRFEHGTASADWTHLDWDPDDAKGINFFCLPSWAYDASARPHVAVGFAADYTTVRTRASDTEWANVVTPRVGLMDVTFGGAKSPVAFGQELILSGPLPVSFAGDAFETAGIELAPEVPTITGTAGAATVSYVIVYETLRPDGSTSRSATSYIVTRTYASPDPDDAPALTLAIPTLRATTHDSVLISVYRTIWDGTQQLPGFHKITVDVAGVNAFDSSARNPIWNDPTVDSVTFVDNIPPFIAETGEPLYTDDGTLDNHPPPPFSCSAVLGDRAFVGGYDDRIYYSFSRTPGQALAFNEDVLFVTLPTGERPTSLVAVDNRLIVFTERSRYTLDGGQFLDATGAGINPTPVRIPGAHDGCTGYAVQTNDGVLYSSGDDTIRLLNRGLESIDVSGPVEDDLGPFVGAAIDEDQRVAFVTSLGKALVLDPAAGCWYVWEPPTLPVAATAHLGQLVYADDAAQPRVLTYDPDSFADNGTAFIQTRIQVNSISTSAITGFNVLWEASALGQWLGAHTFVTRVYYDGQIDPDESFTQAFPTAVLPFEFNWQPKNIECSTIGIEIYDTNDTPSRGFALEGLGLYVGVERGTKYGPRVAPTP